MAREPVTLRIEQGEGEEGVAAETEGVIDDARGEEKRGSLWRRNRF